MIKLNIKIDLKKESIEEVLITAIEGGSNYWYWIEHDDLVKARRWLKVQIDLGKLERDESTHYSWMDAIFQGYQGKIKIYDKEEVYDEGLEDSTIGTKLKKLGVISMKSIRDGLVKVAQERPDMYSLHFPEYNNGDGDSADVILQYIVMGEIIYG